MAGDEGAFARSGTLWIAVLNVYRRRIICVAAVSALVSGVLVWVLPIAQPLISRPTLYSGSNLPDHMWGRIWLAEDAWVGMAGYGVGWPFESHRYSARIGNNRFPTREPIEGVIDAHVSMAGGPLLIPTRPIWIGLVLNWLVIRSVSLACMRSCCIDAERGMEARAVFFLRI